MIHTATKSVKFRRLVRALSMALDCSKEVAKVRAVGHLELLWHLTIDVAKRGDIGKLDDIEIADEIGWDGDAEEIIEILILTGWIDRDERHRLVIHDWHEHAPTFIKKNIHRAGGFIKVDSESQNPSSCEDDFGLVPAQVRIEIAKNDVTCPTPNLTNPNLTKSNEIDSSPDGEPPIPNEQVLDELIDSWNQLPEEIRKVSDRRGKAITKGWKKVQSKADHRRYFSDIPKIMQSIRGSPWLCRQGFFDLVWLFGQKQGRWNVEKVVSGYYGGDERGDNGNPARY